MSSEDLALLPPSDLTLGAVGAPVTRLALTSIWPHTDPVAGAGRGGAVRNTLGQVGCPLVARAALQHQPLLLLLLKYDQITQPSPAPVPHLGGDLIPHLSLVAGTPEGERPAEDVVAGLVGNLLVDSDGDRVAEILTINMSYSQIS